MNRRLSIANRIFAGVIYGYLALPFIIFAFGWLKWYLAIIIGGLAIAGLVLCIKDTKLSFDVIFDSKSWVKIGFVLFILMFWVRLSGISALAFQNHDHWWRNTIFKLLATRDWPVYGGTADAPRAMIYYLGSWLPSALIAKIFGYDAGWNFQIVWAYIGIVLVYLMICAWRKRVDIWPALVFMCFSGLDLIGKAITSGDVVSIWDTSVLEGWVVDMQFINHTAQLYWVFNQAIPGWLCTMLFMMEDTKKNILYPMACIMICATFPFAGLIFVAMYFGLKGIKSFKELKILASIQNIVGVFAIGVTTLLYLMGNMFMAQKQTASAIVPGLVAVSPVRNLAVNMFSGRSSQMTIWLTFCLIEFVVYLMYVYRYQKYNPLYYVVLGWLMVCPFIKVGESFDFGARSCIPCLFIIMLWVIDAIDQAYVEKRKAFLLSLIVVLAVASISATHEIHQNIVYTVSLDQSNSGYYAGGIEEEVMLYGGNFSGGTDGFFFKYMAR